MSDTEYLPEDETDGAAFLPLDVIFRDDNLIAINKPSGLLVHREACSRELPAAVQLLRDQIGQHVYPVHRLDRGTSGVLLFALTKDAASRLCKAIREHELEKTYLAVVRGFTHEEGVMDDPLKPENKKGAAQAAITAYRRIDTTELPFPVGPYQTCRYSLVEARPKTGRWHQIRRHFSHISHPIVGDVWHGDSDHNRFFREQFACHRLLLAATELRIPHPYDSREMVLRAPLPPDVQDLLQRIELHLPQQTDDAQT